MLYVVLIFILEKGMGDVHVLQENKSFDVTVIEEYSEDALKVSSSYIKSC